MASKLTDMSYRPQIFSFDVMASSWKVPQIIKLVTKAPQRLMRCRLFFKSNYTSRPLPESQDVVRVIV